MAEEEHILTSEQYLKLSEKEREEIDLKMRLGSEYLDHKIFEQLNLYLDFYNSLSYLSYGYVSSGIDFKSSVSNLDYRAFSSIKGTIESIKDILKKGRINDAYSLVRKYDDSTIINIYSILFLEDNYRRKFENLLKADNSSIDDLLVKEINNWMYGEESLPEYRIMSDYIRKANQLKDLNALLYNENDNRYRLIRKRCNDNTHYNFYYNFCLNDNEIMHIERVKWLEMINKDIENLFIRHFAYLFCLKSYYMSSSDYADYMDMGMQPPENSQYWVAPIIQDTFDKTIKIKRPDIAEYIIKSTCMQLN